MGIEKVAEIFYKQITRRRKNYSQKTENFFRLFFERHLTPAPPDDKTYNL
jgi:hypothetical protein